MSEPTTDLLPLSYINQFDYCPRRFWYIYVQGQMVENVHVLRGNINHERAHTPGYETIPTGVTIHRQVHVYSYPLGINGVCDLLEEHVDGRLVPVEYKQGQQGKWNNDQAQLCAQALCLEEMTSGKDYGGKNDSDKNYPAITHGFIFYFGSRRRVEVPFTPQLRAYTRQLITAMQQALALGQLPPHTSQRQRCNGCSLIDICLPKETEVLTTRA